MIPRPIVVLVGAVGRRVRDQDGIGDAQCGAMTLCTGSDRASIYDEPLLASLYSASVAGRIATGQPVRMAHGSDRASIDMYD